MSNILQRKVAITKQARGTAIEYQEPAVQGRIIMQVFDTTTGGDFELMVIDTDERQHQANLALTGVDKLAEAQAVDLAAHYQPARTTTRRNPRTLEEEHVSVPTLDLRHSLARAGAASPTECAMTSITSLSLGQSAW